MFDSSVKRGQPARFPVGGVIKGWTEGLQLMTVGEKARFWIPAELAYGESPGGGRPAGMLVFDVELLGITKAPEPPKTPEDVSAAPKSAKKTASGIAYRVLKKGSGKEHPTADSTVEVHYSGWTTDGKMFDSSVARGQPATFPLRGVIPGWTEGVQLMVVGEKTRFWIPGNLAYDNSPRPGAPHGTLVFDIELLDIK
jgi:peptidylprolyl isomerase